MISNTPRPLKALALVATHAAGFYLLWRAWALGASPLELLAWGLAGYAFLDLVTLLVHWALDNYFAPTTPLIGSVVFYFREHHQKPNEMFSRGYIDNNFEQVFVAWPFQLAGLLLQPSAGWCAFLAIGSLGACYITQIHKWSHMREPPRLVRALQALRLVVDKRHHDGHHRRFDCNYGLCAGWFDGVFASLRILEGLEAVVFALSGQRALNRREGR